MATATLTLREEMDDGTRWYAVESNPFVESFEPPAGRDWADFTVDDDEGHEASYAWASGADKLEALARRIVAGEASVRALLEVDRFSWYLERFADELEEPDDTEEGQAAIVELLRDALATPGAFQAYDDRYSFYQCDTDQFLSDAGEALELPEWATLEIEGDGGPGSGFDQPYVVLPPDRTLHDLAAWLSRRERGGRTGE